MGIQLANLCDAELDAFFEEFMQQEISSSCEIEATGSAVCEDGLGCASMAEASPDRECPRA